MAYPTSARAGAVRALYLPPLRLAPDWFDRVGYAIGACFLGAAIGFFLTLGLERIEPMFASGVSGVLYLAALYLAGDCLFDQMSRNGWITIVLASVSSVSLLIWPLAIFIAAQGSPLFLVGPPLSLLSAIALTAMAPAYTQALNRASLTACFVGALARTRR